MKFSYQWISDLVDGLSTDAHELARLITMKTAECEGVEEAGALLRDASPARIVSAEPIPGSTHNQKVLVETSKYGPKTVVCGAPNCRPGIFSVYVPVGMKTVLGIESDGMLASAIELGISRDSAGIVELHNDNLPLTPDSVIEVDNKSLTHRPDLWGHHGMAREVAAITRRPLRDPVDLALLPRAADAPIAIEIEDLNLCPRYSALMVDNVTIRPSPLWLQYRLQSIGLNPISNIVDVTNYVMACIAQPMHAFDADKLQGPAIIVRPARPGESITALNDEHYELTPANLVIADSSGPVGIAGVMGGAETAISDATTRIVFESANFHAASVRKTSVALKLRTDASMRFEKSQDPVNTVRGLALAIALLEQVSPGMRIIGGVADLARPLASPPPIPLSVPWLERKLGRSVSTHEVETILASLGFIVQPIGTGHLSVTVPSWRATKDVSIADDLVEEVGRMLGYDSITPHAPRVESIVPPPNPGRVFEHRVREIFADEGFTEVANYSFVTEAAANRFGVSAADHLRIANPIAADQELLRTSLLAGIVRNISDNSRHFSSFRLFEIGVEIHKRAAGLPEEIPHVAAAMFSREGGGVAQLFELKRVAECLMRDCETNPTTARPFEHPQRAAIVRWRGRDVGRLFELHPSFDLHGRGAILDLDLALMLSLQESENKYRPLRRFPTSAFDLSVVAPTRSRASEIQRQLKDLAGSALVAIEFVRDYALSPAERSISFRITVGAVDKTLSSDEVAAVRKRIIDGMTAAGYELRL